MRLAIAAIIIGAVIPSPAMSAETIRPGLVVNDMEEAFRLAAVSVKDMVAIYAPECKQGHNMVCSYPVAGPIEISATGAAETADADSVTVIYKPNGDPEPLIRYLGLLVIVAEPDMPESERAKIMVALSEGGAKGAGAAAGKNADFSALDLGSEGIWFTAAAKK